MKRLAIMTGAVVAAGGLCLALGASTASAQIGASKEPIQVTAAKLEGTRDDGKLVYLENVEAVQGKSTMKADKLTVVCDLPPKGQAATGGATNCKEVKQLIAESNVFYITEDEKIRGDRAEYDYATDTITVTGDPVILSRGADGVISGKKLVYQVSKGIALMSGDTKAARVTSILTTKSKDEPAAPAAAAPATRP